MYNRQNHTDQDLSTPSRQNFVPTKGILDCVLYVRINPVDLVNGWGLLVCFQNKLVQTLCKLLCRPWPWSMSDTAAAVVTCPCYVTTQLIVRGNSPALGSLSDAQLRLSVSHFCPGHRACGTVQKFRCCDLSSWANYLKAQDKEAAVLIARGYCIPSDGGHCINWWWSVVLNENFVLY